MTFARPQPVSSLSLRLCGSFGSGIKIISESTVIWTNGLLCSATGLPTKVNRCSQRRMLSLPFRFISTCSHPSRVQRIPHEHRLQYRGSSWSVSGTRQGHIPIGYPTETWMPLREIKVRLNVVAITSWSWRGKFAFSLSELSGNWPARSRKDEIGRSWSASQGFKHLSVIPSCGSSKSKAAIHR